MTPATLEKRDGSALWRWALAGYWLALFAATHLPVHFPGLPGAGADWLVHFAAFAILAWLLVSAWERTVGRLHRRHLHAAWWLLVLYAAADELTQLLVGRTASAADWLADAAGAALGLALFAAWRPRFQ
jgi:VanZ family protein